MSGRVHFARVAAPAGDSSALYGRQATTPTASTASPHNSSLEGDDHLDTHHLFSQVRGRGKGQGWV